MIGEAVLYSWIGFEADADDVRNRLSGVQGPLRTEKALRVVEALESVKVLDPNAVIDTDWIGSGHDDFVRTTLDSAEHQDLRALTTEHQGSIEFVAFKDK